VTSLFQIRTVQCYWNPVFETLLLNNQSHNHLSPITNWELRYPHFFQSALNELKCSKVRASLWLYQQGNELHLFTASFEGWHKWHPKWLVFGGSPVHTWSGSMDCPNKHADARMLMWRRPYWPSTSWTTHWLYTYFTDWCYLMWNTDITYAMKRWRNGSSRTNDDQTQYGWRQTCVRECTPVSELDLTWGLLSRHLWCDRVLPVWLYGTLSVTADCFSAGQSPDFFSIHKIMACDSVLRLLNPLNTFVCIFARSILILFCDLCLPAFLADFELVVFAKKIICACLSCVIFATCIA